MRKNKHIFICLFPCLIELHSEFSFSKDTACSKMLHSLTSSLQVGNSNGLVQVLNMSTGHYPKGGTSKVAGHVTALNFDSSGKTLWAGDDKVKILFLLGHFVAWS